MHTPSQRPVGEQRATRDSRRLFQGGGLRSQASTFCFLECGVQPENQARERTSWGVQARLWKGRREVLGSVYNHEALPSIPFFLDIEHKTLSLLQWSLGVPMWTEGLSSRSPNPTAGTGLEREPLLPPYCSNTDSRKQTWARGAAILLASHCQEEDLHFKRAIKKASLKHSKSKQSRKAPKFPNPRESYLSLPESLTIWA